MCRLACTAICNLNSSYLRGNFSEWRMLKLLNRRSISVIWAISMACHCEFLSKQVFKYRCLMVHNYTWSINTWCQIYFKNVFDSAISLREMVVENIIYTGAKDKPQNLQTVASTTNPAVYREILISGTNFGSRFPWYTLLQFYGLLIWHCDSNYTSVVVLERYHVSEDFKKNKKFCTKQKYNYFIKFHLQFIFLPLYVSRYSNQFKQIK